MAGAGRLQHAHPAHAPRARRRPAHHQRLRLRQPGPRRSRAAAGARRDLPAPRRPLLRQLGRHLRGVEGQGHGAAGGDPRDGLLAAARARGRVGDLRPPRLLDRLQDDPGLPAPGRRHVRDVPVPLRDAQSRVRRVPDVLRVLQAGVPQHHRPGHLADGGRAARRPLPARRRAQAPEQGGDPPRHRRGGGRRRTRPRPCSRACPRATPAASGWPTGSAPRTRGSSSTPTAGTPAATTTPSPGSRTPTCRSARSRSTSRTCAGATRSTGRPSRCSPSASASPASTAS